jgi:hypothetical protein
MFVQVCVRIPVLAWLTASQVWRSGQPTGQAAHQPPYYVGTSAVPTFAPSLCHAIPTTLLYRSTLRSFPIPSPAPRLAYAFPSSSLSAPYIIQPRYVPDSYNIPFISPTFLPHCHTFSTIVTLIYDTSQRYTIIMPLLVPKPLAISSRWPIMHYGSIPIPRLSR